MLNHENASPQSNVVDSIAAFELSNERHVSLHFRIGADQNDGSDEQQPDENEAANLSRDAAMAMMAQLMENENTNAEELPTTTSQALQLYNFNNNNKNNNN